ncbi:Stk1 family PASTA domain-containing Ser/Thr kinase [Paenibacillus sp. UMB4589-SE434]|uniref:Stk1 family PASTA domain-containing Ser/Thr kinase n=1 Tax=Paenibacillus sp. UMB4589-SE434 TaxID=3046314 RepID=UPI00254B026B|nr:Stk1 family PASTA domain-containing Ser/Thr kinase [Paenibacillus sp. UMB4589-SE434]MDK8180015.1 PASTA domain-containing protein [Paenibacillus sp. UMB4589-SE434]
MNNQMIDGRYELVQTIMQSDDGTWYRAQDTSLKREIFLLLSTGTPEDSLRELTAELSQSSSDSFFQLLNAGTDGPNAFMVFNAYKGMPLYQYAEKHAVPLQTALQIVFLAGQRLQEGGRLGTSAFSVSFDNLWITDQHELLVMNYWNEARSSRTGTSGLSQLLYQLCTLHALAPRQYDIYVSRMQSALKHELPAQRQSVLTLARRVYQDDESVLGYMTTITEILNQPNLPIVDSYAQYEVKATQSPTYESLSSTTPEAYVADSTLYDEPETAYDTVEQEERPQTLVRERTQPDKRVQQAPKRKLRTPLIIAGCILFVSLLGGAIIWANSLSKSSDAATEPESTVTTPNDADQHKEETSESNQVDNGDGSTSTDNGSSAGTDSTTGQVEPGTTNQGGTSESGNTDSTSNENGEGSVQQPNQGQTTDPGTTSPNTGVETEQPTTGGTDGTTTPGTNPGTTTPPVTTDPTAPTEPTVPTDPNGNTTQPTTPSGTAPNLVGLTQAEAEKAALAAGMKYSFAKENAEGQEAGKVFKQEPAAGTAVKKGDRVTFYIVREAKK